MKHRTLYSTFSVILSEAKNLCFCRDKPRHACLCHYEECSDQVIQNINIVLKLLCAHVSRSFELRSSIRFCSILNLLRARKVSHLNLWFKFAQFPRYPEFVSLIPSANSLAYRISLRSVRPQFRWIATAIFNRLAMT